MERPVRRSSMSEGGRRKRYPSIACRGCDGFRGTQPILRIDNKTGSSDLPVGLFVDRRVESYFCFSEKYFCSHSPQIRSRTFRIPPHQRGVSRSSRTRGGMRWTRQRFARDGIAGRASVRERLPSERTRDVAAYGEVVWS